MKMKPKRRHGEVVAAQPQHRKPDHDRGRRGNEPARRQRQRKRPVLSASEGGRSGRIMGLRATGKVRIAVT